MIGDAKEPYVSGCACAKRHVRNGPTHGAAPAAVPPHTLSIHCHALTDVVDYILINLYFLSYLDLFQLLPIRKVACQICWSSMGCRSLFAIVLLVH